MTGLIFAMALLGGNASAEATAYEVHQSDVELSRTMAALQDDIDDKAEITRLSRKWSRARENRNDNAEATADTRIQEWLAAEIEEGTLEVQEARREIAASRHELSQSRRSLHDSRTGDARRAFLDDQKDLEDDIADLEGAENRLARTIALRDELVELEASFGWRISRKEQAAKQALLRRLVRHSQQAIVASVEERNEDRAERSEMYHES